MSDVNRCKTKYEILAPAGSAESLFAAVNNGCDSVYLGLDGFNARMKAPNFTAYNLAEYVDFCHLFGVKVYVTVNTSVKNDEFLSAAKTLFAAYKANADGVIVTDLALLGFAAALKGNLDVVASTQLNCHDGYGARFLQKLGATTVVCARESTLVEIKDITDCGVKVESFIHGALCVCQSGQCLLSSLVGGNSGNRGLCAQPCRNFYTASTGKKGYLLSTADLNGTDEYKDLLNAGVSVFKIEGRNRSAEYAAVCSKAFKQLFDTGKIDEQTTNDLKEVYSRGEMIYLPYLNGQNDGLIFPSHPRHVGRQVGVVKNGKIVAAENLKKGDGFKVFDRGREVCGAVALSDGKTVEAKFSDKVSDGMIVCRTSSVELTERVLATKRKISARAEFIAAENQNAVLRLINEDCTVEVQSDFVCEKARSQPTTTEEIAKQLSKTGDSHTTITNIVVKTDGVFVTKSQINALRRNAVALLEQQIIDKYNARFTERKNVTFDKAYEVNSSIDKTCDVNGSACKEYDEQSNTGSIRQSDKHRLAVTCYDEKQIDDCVADGNLTDGDIVVFKPSTFDNALLQRVAQQRFVYLDLPSFADLTYIKTAIDGANIGIVCHNVGHVQFARDNGLRYILGRGMNVFNDKMLRLFPDTDGFVYSYELTLNECKNFAADDGFAFVDGRFAVMQLVHCPYKTVYGNTCADCKADKGLSYTDQRGNEFVFARRRDGRCTFELINGLKLSSKGKAEHPFDYLVDYDKNVVTHYAKLNKGTYDNYSFAARSTTGRLFNKIK